MVHGPCGLLNPLSPCMKEGKCSKSFPKQYCDNTEIPEDGFITYQRRNNGQTVSKSCNGRSVDVDNQWIVPYNGFLLQRYNCHINVEICSSVKAVKYLYKYSYKGPDRLNIQIDDSQQHDEIEEYLDCRYISPPEACWRIFGFSMHSQSHSVERLPVHLEDSQTIIFSEDADNEDLNNALERGSITKLTSFFSLCAIDPSAKELLYHEIPEKYKWDQPSKSWTKRRNNKNVVARMYSVNPSEGERYYLRLLLCHVKGPTSFQCLKTVNEIEYQTFKEAAIARGLLEDDQEYLNCMNEATLSASPNQLRFLFATIIHYCTPRDPEQLWYAFRESMSEDSSIIDDQQKERETITKINEILKVFGTTIHHYISTLPEGLIINDINTPAANEEYLHNISKLNQRQKEVFDEVIRASTEIDDGKVFFLDGPGGTGKTFLYNCIIAKLTSTGNICIPVASSGIAAELLQGGTTAHSKFKIPINNITQDSTCNISAQSTLAAEIKTANLIIWDEVPMVNKLAVEAVDRTLRDIMQIPNLPFGGKAVLFGGDFRQILPVVERGSRSKIINASLKSSYLWNLIVKRKLIENMRVEEETQDFSNLLLNIGEGRCNISDVRTRFQIPGNDLDTLINFVHNDYNNIDFNNVILTTTNKVCYISKI